jgi:hypothetical protein
MLKIIYCTWWSGHGIRFFVPKNKPCSIMQIDKEWNGFWSISTIAIILAWLYTTAYAVCMLVSALQPDAGTWDVASCLFMGMFFLPVVVIPIFLDRSFRKRRPVRLGKILPGPFGSCISRSFLPFAIVIGGPRMGGQFSAEGTRAAISDLAITSIISMALAAANLDRAFGFGSHLLSWI